MKHIAASLFLFSLLVSTEASAFDNPPVEHDALYCYSYSMVGYDSVINSRLGVPAEYALGLAMKNPLKIALDERYSIFILKVVLNAYLWPDSPHDYAVRVFYNCARAQGLQRGAALGDDLVMADFYSE